MQLSYAYLMSLHNKTKSTELIVFLQCTAYPNIILWINLCFDWL